MSRYIDADALKKSVEGLTDCYNGFSDTYDKACIIGIIDEEPTVDAVEVKHGHWVHDFGGYVECSNCGALPLLDGERGYVESEYCPWCGAKMDEVTE